MVESERSRTSPPSWPGRVAVIQTVIPNYRVPLFDRLHASLAGRVTFYGAPTAIGHPKSDVPPSDHYQLCLDTAPMAGGRVTWQLGAFRVLQSLRRGDVLVVPGDPRLISNIPLMLQARARGIKTLWWGHGFTAGTAHRVGLRQRMMKLADAVLLYTDREVQRYRDMGVSLPSLYALNNAIDQNAIRQAKAEWMPHRLAAFRRENDIQPERTLITVGRVTEKMRIPVAIRALAEPALREYRLVVVGDGPDRAPAEELARGLGVHDRIRWLGAIYEERQLAPWLSSAETFVYPGAVGLSIFHAFGYGLPVVTHSNEVNQMPEFAALRPNINGALFQPEDHVDLAQTIVSLQDSLPRLRAGAEATAMEEWTIEGATHRFAQSILATAGYLG